MRVDTHSNDGNGGVLPFAASIIPVASCRPLRSSSRVAATTMAWGDDARLGCHHCHGNWDCREELEADQGCEVGSEDKYRYGQKRSKC